MELSHGWLAEYVDLEATPEEVATRLTAGGFASGPGGEHVVGVGAGSEIRQQRHRPVGNAGQGQVDRAQRSRPGADGRPDLFLRGEGERHGDALQAFHLQ